MPSHEEHCQDSLKRYSKRFDELHRWMDEPSTVLGRDHRIHRHDPVTTPLIAKKIFGELADQACLDHIRLDELEQRRSKRKKSKEGYWKTRKYRRISVEKDIHGYWSDEFLYNMIENCNETSYTKNQDYLRKRDKGLVATLFLTGGRVREVLMLKKDNFDFENEEAQRSKAFLVKK